MEILEKSPWFKELLEEAERFDSGLFPPMPEANGVVDQVIGECPEYLRKFHALATMLAREKERLSVEYRYVSADSEDHNRLSVEISKLGTKEDLVREILWACLRAEFSTWESARIGIRKDWKVVVGEHLQDDFVKVLKAKLGM
jgi:hypothetical protein